MSSLRISAILILAFSYGIYSQEIPQLDTLRLNSGLKVYFLNHGEDTMVTYKLVIDAGKKDETTCQLGYSEMILGVLKESLSENQKTILKKENTIQSSIQEGQTLLQNSFPIKEMDVQMRMLSTCIARLKFTKEKVDEIAQKLVDTYSTENIDSKRLADIYRNLSLYSDKNSLGRSYCQYQVQKALPENIMSFYNQFYQPFNASLIICGNFDARQVKKTIVKHFIKWRETYKEEHSSFDLKNLEIQNKEIIFVNKWASKHCTLKWLRSAPSPTSSVYPTYLLSLELFENLISTKLKDTANNKVKQHFSHFSEWNLTVSNDELMNTINELDTLSKLFYNYIPSEWELNEAKQKLLKDYKAITTSAEVLSFYDPLFYDFNLRINYAAQINSIQVKDIQQIIRNYFKPEAYKLIIVGKELALSQQLNAIKNLKTYRTLDFETCDEACKEVIVIKYHCESCYRRGQSNVWRFDPNDKEAIKVAKSRAKATAK